MKHTFFLSGMKWEAEGIYYDEKENTFNLRGESNAVRTDKEWSLDGFIEVLSDKPVRFYNKYKIFETNKKNTLKWESLNPAIGILKGSFEIIGSKIISVYASEQGDYTGTETLIQKDEKTYDNAGVFFYKGQKISSWTTILKAKNSIL
ncbi:MAG: hypothetical protein VB017_02195 [Endomicrobiaceae bacterium]|jgi:hypothetical protein|nr:hypothetical protein [Endomicrobiaceae bacterium]